MRRPQFAAVVVGFAVVTASLLASRFTVLAEVKGSEAAPQPGSITAEISGVGGMVFHRGQPIEIRWILSGDGVRAFEGNRWAECELFFATAAGKGWNRITPALSATRRSYDWTIPNVTADEAVIGIQLGIEGEGEFYFFRSEPFKIRRQDG